MYLEFDFFGTYVEIGFDYDRAALSIFVAFGSPFNFLIDKTRNNWIPMFINKMINASISTEISDDDIPF